MEQGAEVMWPELSAWEWWGIAAVAAVAWVWVTYWWPFGRRRKPKAADADGEAGAGAVDEGVTANMSWRISPGAGLLATEAIEKAASIDEARRIFLAFQAQQKRRNASEVYAAYTARLKREGLGDTQEAYDVGWDEGGEE